VSVVVDASFVTAALHGNGDDDGWAAHVLSAEDVLAPHLMPSEVTSYLRRAERLGQISPALAVLAHADLTALDVDLLPYAPFAERIWELRHSVTTFDAWYVALAEAFDAPLATLDLRLTTASGPRCAFLTPP
jgi:predicted nucleic acid-binding protein